MSKYIGRRCEVGVGVEATRGTAVNPSYWVPWTSLTFEDKVVKQFQPSGMGRIEDSDDAFVTAKYGEGEVEGELRSIPLGAILYAVFGSVSSASGSGAYTHTYTLSQTNVHKSLSLLTQDPDRAEMFTKTMIDSFQITVEPENIIRYNIGFVSKGSQDWTSQTSDYTTTDYKFLPQHVSVKVASAVGDLAAASETVVKGLTLTISKNAMRDQALGTVQPDDIVNQQFTVEGEVTLNRESDTFKDLFTGDTSQAMQIKFLNPNTIGSTNPTLTIQMPKVFFLDWDQERPLDELTTQTVPFRAVYDAPNNLAVISTCTLVNSNSSY